MILNKSLDDFLKKSKFAQIEDWGISDLMKFENSLTQHPIFLTIFLQTLGLTRFFLMLCSERYKRIYSPQSSPIDSAGFISTVSSLLDAISKSAPQSAQVMISPIIASCGNLISPAQSLHSVIKYFPSLISLYQIYLA